MAAGGTEQEGVAKEPDPTFPSQERAISPQKKPPEAVSTQPDPLGTCLKAKISYTHRSFSKREKPVTHVGRVQLKKVRGGVNARSYITSLL